LVCLYRIHVNINDKYESFYSILMKAAIGLVGRTGRSFLGGGPIISGKEIALDLGKTENGQ
jgi:hypothetical protein